MKETMIMDGHEYFKREDGLWETTDQFEMSMSAWAINGEHVGHIAVFELSGDNMGCPKWVAIDNTGKDSIVSVWHKPNTGSIAGVKFPNQV